MFRKKFLRAAACVACVLCICVAAKGLDFQGKRLSSDEMKQTRGGNPEAMTCVGSCQHLNNYDFPCNGVAVGGSCTMCNVTPNTYNYGQQTTNPALKDCTSTVKGFKPNANNNQQGCGFKATGTCALAASGGLTCGQLVDNTDPGAPGNPPTKQTCTTSIVIEGQ